MKTILTSSIYISKTRKGNEKLWRAHVVQDEERYFTQTEYWQKNQVGDDTVHVFSDPYEAKPKNVGKANETTARAQAYSEWDSIIQKQVDKGYAEEGKVSEVLPLPMLAQKFTERKHTLTWPVYVQPKYNGMRMLYDGKKAWSRGGKLMIPEVIQHLQFDTKGCIVDGELILPGNQLLQETMKAAKKYRPGVSDKLTYVVYDVVDSKIFSHRYYEIVVCLDKPLQVLLAPTYVALNEEEIIKFHKQFVQQGYEGIIVRNNNEGYCIGQRSNQLQKYKTFVDAEFRIVNVLEGEGSYKGCARFECDNGEGRTFFCNPEGTLEYKKELWFKRESLLNKWLTIRYQELSKENVPLFPVGVMVRQDQDFKG
jgi:hypothetical protein